MAAGHQKKRKNAASRNTCDFQQQYRSKVKKSGNSSQNVLNMRSHISLEWDVTQKKAIAKRDQIGIAWSDMAAFADSGYKPKMGLADVFCVPREIFGLEDLTRVLSYEVWETFLSESERELLSQFLPRGADIEAAVQLLLMGDNLHFGNSFLRWGALLCSGNLHPDAVLLRDQDLKANKKAYYSELQEYRNDIIKTLQQWKDMWIRSRDPEKEIVEEMWRKGVVKHKQNGSIFASESSTPIPNSRREIIPLDSDGHAGNAARHASFLKPIVEGHAGISELDSNLSTSTLWGNKQKYHQVQKSNKHGNIIQSRSLNLTLDDAKNSRAKPPKVSEEEEKKLQDYWLMVTRRDIPPAFSHWKERQFQRKQYRKLLEQEIMEMKESSTDEDEEERPEISHEEQGYNEEINMQNHEENSSPLSCSTDHSKSPQQIPSLNSHHEDAYISLDSENCNQEIPKQKITSLGLSQFQENRYPVEDDVEQEAPDHSARESWPAVRMPDSYYHDTATSTSHGYASVGLSFKKPQLIEEHPDPLISLETEMLKQGTGETLSPGLFNEGLLQSYPLESMNSLMQPELCILRRNDGLHDNTRFLGQRQEQQQQLLEQNIFIEKKLHMQRAMQKNMYHRARYETQQLFSPAEAQQVEADPVLGAHFQSANAGFSGPNMFSRERHGSSAWCGMEAALASSRQRMGDGRNTAEGHFCGISQSNNFRRPYPYHSISSVQFNSAREIACGEGISSNSDLFPYSAQPLGYLNAHEAATSAASTATQGNNMLWAANFQRPNHHPGTCHRVGAQFLGPWNP
ncbi:hypothetical protein ACLOJK_025788 [Asimina triloba]